jgi:hypothetical protein
MDAIFFPVSVQVSLPYNIFGRMTVLCLFYFRALIYIPLTEHFIQGVKILVGTCNFILYIIPTGFLTNISE